MLFKKFKSKVAYFFNKLMIIKKHKILVLSKLKLNLFIMQHKNNNIINLLNKEQFY